MASSPASLLVLSLPVEPVPSVDLGVDFVAVVDVEVVWTAAFSAAVSLGGVMSGVLLGTASEALLPPPHAASVVAARSVTESASAARAGEDPRP